MSDDTFLSYTPISYHSPERPRLANGRPCWMGTQVALPLLGLSPVPDSSVWDCRILVAGGAWAVELLKPEAIGWLMRQWERDPERTCVEFFKAQPPSGGRVWSRNVVATGSAEELGL